MHIEREVESKTKQKGFFTPRTTEKESETLKMKKQQENFVMSLFLAQRPNKEALIARNIISRIFYLSQSPDHMLIY